jgi:Pectate lyase superfamily protein
MRGGNRKALCVGKKNTKMSNVLDSGQSLAINQFLLSSNSGFKAILQGDGNFVVYNVQGVNPRQIWATGTNGQNISNCMMQEDGNFVLYNEAGTAVFATGTDGNGASTLMMQDDGNLVIYTSGNAKWSSNSFQHVNTDAVYNVKYYGATGDGTTNDAVAIQSAINAANNAKGGTVFFPPGIYLIESALQLKGIVKLLGSGWSSHNTSAGSFIYFKSTFSGDAVNVVGRNSSIEQLGFFCEQPGDSSSWEPNRFGEGAAIHIRADDVTVRNVFLLNVTRGIDCSNQSGSIGRITLDRIYGQPIEEGIKIDNAMDVMKINNVHFWPFWSNAPQIRNYIANNGTGLVSYRNDNPFYSDIFCLGYKRGISFSKSTMPVGQGIDPNIWGKTSKFKIVNADLDFCGYGVFIDGDSTTGQVSNISCQGPDARAGYEGISVAANDVHLQASDIHITDYSSNGIRISGNQTTVMLNNVWINNWNKSGASFPAIEAVDQGTTIYVNACRNFTNGNGGNNFGGSGRITIATTQSA